MLTQCSGQGKRKPLNIVSASLLEKLIRLWASIRVYLLYSTTLAAALV